MLHNKKKSRSLAKKIAVSSCTALRAFSKKSVFKQHAQRSLLARSNKTVQRSKMIVLVSRSAAEILCQRDVSQRPKTARSASKVCLSCLEDGIPQNPQ